MSISAEEVRDYTAHLRKQGKINSAMDYFLWRYPGFDPVGFEWMEGEAVPRDHHFRQRTRARDEKVDEVIDSTLLGIMGLFADFLDFLGFMWQGTKNLFRLSREEESNTGFGHLLESYRGKLDFMEAQLGNCPREARAAKQGIHSFDYWRIGKQATTIVALDSEGYRGMDDLLESLLEYEVNSDDIQNLAYGFFRDIIGLNHESTVGMTKKLEKYLIKLGNLVSEEE